MSYDVVVTDQPDRQVVAVYIFQRTPIERFVLQPPPGTFMWERLSEGEEASPTFAFGGEIVDRLAHQLAEHFHVDRPEQTEQRRISYLEGEQSGMRRHLDGLESLFRRVVTLVPEGPAFSAPGGQLVNTTLDERAIGDNDGDLGPGGVDYWRRRALNAEATIRDALGETAPPRPPRRILDVEPDQNVPLSRSDDRTYTVPGFAGEEAR